MIVICKFREINERFTDSISRGYVYFAHPDQLNDPFDCKISISKSLNHAIDKTKGKIRSKLEQLRDETGYFDELNQRLSSSGIFSSSYNIHSKSIREPLLWSHYGDSHKGVCLTYNIPEEYILGNSMAGVPVKYEKNSLTNFFIKWSKSKKTLTNHDFVDELVKKYLSIKDVPWKYENEYRLIRSDSGEFELDKSFLKYVCYGLNTPPKNRGQVNTLLEEGSYEAEKREMVRTESDFGIQERKI